MKGLKWWRYKVMKLWSDIVLVGKNVGNECERNWRERMERVWLLIGYSDYKKMFKNLLDLLNILGDYFRGVVLLGFVLFLGFLEYRG